MKFNIQNILNDISENKTLSDKAEAKRVVNVVKPARVKLKSLARAIKDVFKETVITEEFRLGVLEAEKRDPDKGVILLIKAAHQHILNISGELIKEKMAGFPMSKIIMAEILMERAIGTMMKIYQDGQESFSPMGLGKHPVFSSNSMPSQDDSHIAMTAGNKESYPNFSGKNTQFYKDNVLHLAKSEKLWGKIKTPDLIDTFFHMQTASLEFFTKPDVNNASSFMWIGAVNEAVERYVEKTSKEREIALGKTVLFSGEDIKKYQEGAELEIARDLLKEQSQQTGGEEWQAVVNKHSDQDTSQPDTETIGNLRKAQIETSSFEVNNGAEKSEPKVPGLKGNI